MDERFQCARWNWELAGKQNFNLFQLWLCRVIGKNDSHSSASASLVSNLIKDIKLRRGLTVHDRGISQIVSRHCVYVSSLMFKSQRMSSSWASEILLKTIQSLFAWTSSETWTLKCWSVHCLTHNFVFNWNTSVKFWNHLQEIIQDKRQLIWPPMRIFFIIELQVFEIIIKIFQDAPNSINQKIKKFSGY